MTNFLLNAVMCIVIFGAGTYATVRVWDYFADCP